MAAGNNHVSVLAKLAEILKNNSEAFTALLNGQNESKNTPLHWAALCRQIEAIEKLIELGADCGIVNIEEQTPLDLVIGSGDEKLVELLAKNTKMNKSELEAMNQAAASKPEGGEAVINEDEEDEGKSVEKSEESVKE